MKKVLLLFFFIICFQGLFAQIIPEQTYNHSGTFSNLAHSGNKFFIMDVSARQCRIYNMDHSLWKVISLTVPMNNFLYDIRYVSEGLFSLSNEVALVYVYYSYNTSTQVYTYNARIITETGQELLFVPGCSYVSVHDFGEEGKKLLAYVYNYAVTPVTVETRIYSLPREDTPVAVSFPSGKKESITAWPNPARDFSIINYSLPAGVKQGDLFLYDMNGILVRSFRVDNNFDHLRIDTSGFPAGVYLYRLLNETGRLIIQ